MADNVVLRREGILEPRPGFERAQDYATTGRARAILPFDQDAIVITDEPSAYWLSDGAPIADVGFPLETERKSVEARKNLYFTSAESVRKLHDRFDDTAKPIGLPEPYCPKFFNVTSGSTLAPGVEVYYRVCFKRTDANGLELRSAPSEKVYVVNDTVGSRSPTLELLLPKGIRPLRAGDEVEFYRTTDNFLVDDSLQLAFTHELTDDDIAAGFVLLKDTSEPGERGAELYTTTNQEGALQRNDVPPACQDLALFRNHLFYIRPSYPHVVALRTRFGADDNPGGLGFKDDGTYTTSADFTIASDQTDGNDDFEVGAAISTFDPILPPRTTIIANDGNGNITLSQEAAINFSDANIVLHPRVRVGDVNFYWGPTSQHGYDTEIVQDADEVTYYGLDIANARALARAINTEGTYEAWTVDDLILIRARSANAGEFTVECNAAHRYSPNASSLLSDDEEVENGFAWSKAEQPEHAPRSNATRVGSSRNKLLRAIETRDVLFLFSTEGAWAVSGFEGNFRVDPIDPTLSLISPETAVALQDRVMGWFTRGVCAVSTAGAAPISEPTIGETLRARQSVFAASNRNAIVGLQAAASESDREYLLTVPNTLGEDGADELFVFHLDTAAWSRWTLPGRPSAIARDPHTDKTLVAWDEGAAHAVWKERKVAGNPIAADDHEDVTVTDVGLDGLTLTLDPTTLTPEPGDVLVQGGATYVIVGDGDGVLLVDRPGLTLAEATLYKHFVSTVEFVARTTGNADTAKQYCDTIWLFESLKGLHGVQAAWASDTATPPLALDFDLFDEVVTGAEPGVQRYWAPREHGRTQQLFPKLTLATARAKWELAGVSQYVRLTSSRVWR